MSEPRFYCPQDLRPGHEIELDEEVTRHIGYALRLKPGDSLTLFNGMGGESTAHIVSCQKKTISVFVEDFSLRNRESNLIVNLNIVMSKGDRMDQCIQKATELGAARITPLFSERCEVKLPAHRVVNKTIHWQRVAISSCEQCGRNSVPEILPPQRLKQCLENETGELKLLLSPGGPPISNHDLHPTSVALLSGPEGGFSEDEESVAVDAGYFRVGIGPRILRAETAPLVALTLVQYMWGDL